jgi:hypothetical protein
MRIAMAEPTQLTPEQQRDFEAAAFRRLVAHLRQRSDVQNIDLMNLAGFCRNCLSNWYREAAEADGVPLSKEESREIIYGMPYAEWQSRFQTDASPEQKAAFEQNRSKDHP